MNNLSKIRANKGLTLEQVGQLAGISKQRICVIEKGNMTPTNAKRIAKALGVNPIELLGEDVLKIIPQNNEEKEIMLNIVKSIEVE